MKESYIHTHKSDCTIERMNGRNTAEILNDEGDTVIRFPSHWSDNDAWRALQIANDFYGVGIDTGKQRKSIELRRALDI